MPCLLNVNLCTSCCVCTHVSKILLIAHVVVLGGVERDVQGEGRHIPLASEYTQLQKEGAMTANRSHLPIV